MVNEKFILITGTSSGLGKALVRLLSREPYKVIAGVRTEKDKALFANNDFIIPVILDVTKPDQVLNAFEKIDTLTRQNGLFALINNAGINYLSAFELADEYQERHLFEVNLFGAMALTRKLLPLMHRYVSTCQGRAKIINISSIGAVFGLPWESAYHASKFAMKGWSQSLRFELEGLRISVCCFMPGGMKTMIFQKSISKQSFSQQNKDHVHYSFYKNNQENMNNVLSGFEKRSSDTVKAARSILKLLDGDNMPAKRYFGADAAFIRIACWLGITGILKNRFVVR